MPESKLTDGFVPSGTSDRDLQYILRILERPEVEQVEEIDEFARFCALLRGLKAVSAGDGQPATLDFEDAPALGLRDGVSLLLLRECYFELEAQITWSLTAIVGTPGIGKTMFMAFCLWRLAQEDNVAVLCQIQKIYYAVVWRRKEEPKICRLGKFQAEGLALVDTCWYLADLHGAQELPLDGRARTIVFTSPNPQKYHAYVIKRSGDVLYMPPWTEKELQHYAQASGGAFYQGDGACSMEDCVRERYARYGGVPRIVLASREGSFISHSESFEQALAGVPKNLAQFCDIWKKVDNALPENLVGVSDKVLHMIPEQGSRYRRVNRNFCSENVKDEVFARFKKGNRQEVIDFVLEEQTNRYIRSFQGTLFENVLHDKFQAEYDLCVREFQGLEGLEPLAHGLYYKPQTINFGAVDAFHVWKEDDRDGPTVVEMLQMTVGKEHEICADSLNKIVEFLKENNCCGTALAL